MYRPIATYDREEDIIAIFPCDKPKPDMGDIIYGKFQEGYGEPREIMSLDEPESWWDEEDVASDENFILTADKKHGVRFTRGEMIHGTPYGYYIDIYEQFNPEDEDYQVFDDEDLKRIARERLEQNARIKKAIVREFKAAFNQPGQGIDFCEYSPETVFGALDETGDIGKLILREDGTIAAVLIQEYDDPVENFEDKYFHCGDWPKLLLLFREGIRDEWFIHPDEEDEE